MNGLNLTVPEHAKEVIKPWDKRDTTEQWVESGVDDQVSLTVLCSIPYQFLFRVTDRLCQIILNIPFTQSVRVRSLLIKIGT